MLYKFDCINEKNLLQIIYHNNGTWKLMSSQRHIYVSGKLSCSYKKQTNGNGKERKYFFHEIILKAKK